MATHLPLKTLEAGLIEILGAPKDEGAVVLIVRRPQPEMREVVEEAQLDPEVGMVGDDWKEPAGEDAKGAPRPANHLGVMSARVAGLVAGTPDRRPLSSDQLYLDLDLSQANLPPGTRLAVGEAVIEVTPATHVAGENFAERFGSAALKFVNTPQGRAMRLRGLNASVVEAGVVRNGDRVRKLPPTSS